MGKLVERIEDAVSGTALEAPALWTWSQLKSIGRPRALQSVEYDRQTTAILKRLLHRDSNCIDIGAHRGGILRQIVELAPNGKHLAFEPLPHLAQKVSKRFPSVTVHQIALSDVEGTATFCYVVDDPGRSGLRKMGHIDARSRTQEIRVRTGRLDDFAPDRQIAFIKIDVEGAQLQVLHGALQTISHNRPHIVFEHGMLAKESYGTTSDMIFDVLVEQCGLKISRLRDWLHGVAPLTRVGFDAHVGYHPTSEFMFIAHP